MILEVEPRSADFRSILPRYVLESGSACVDCDASVGKSFHLQGMSSQTKTLRFCPSPPPLYHIRHVDANLPKMDGGGASIPTLYIHRGVGYHLCVVWVGGSIMQRNVVLLRG